MRRELHIWFSLNMHCWNFLEDDVVESYDGLRRALKKKYRNHGGNVVIHTHNVIFADSRIIEEYGFRLFIHPAVGDMFEITFGRCANTKREIKPIHCLWRMLLSGEFDTDECQVISEDF